MPPMSVYSKAFLFEECGFDWVPDDIDRALLFNLSYDLGSGEVKLYILDESRRFLHKVSRGGITWQHEAVEFLTRVHECDAASLEAHLTHMWVSSELHFDRLTLTTQYHQLVH